MLRSDFGKCLISLTCLRLGKAGVVMKSWHNKEIQVQRAIEDQGFTVHNANIVFRANCPNIDLIVFARAAATYIQVKSSSNPADKDTVVIDGSPWTEEQLSGNSPIFNKRDGFNASLIVIVDVRKTGETEYYIAPPMELEKSLIPIGCAFANRLKRDGTRRKMFRKELPREILAPWHNAWRLLGERPFR
jgi:hypothetical protein